jgi:hypothetical protein
MPPPTADVSFQTGIFLASSCAGIFWLASALGKTVTWPWQTPVPMPPEERATHQARWNANAAASAAIAALIQGFQILYNLPPLWPH